MNYILEMSSDGGKSWKRWPNEDTTYTEHDAKAIILQLKECNERLKIFDIDREEKRWANIDMYMLRVSDVPLTQPSSQQPSKVKELTALEWRKS